MKRVARFLILERAGLSKVLKRIPAPLGVLYAVGVFTFGWSLFLHEDLTDAWRFILSMLGLQHGNTTLYFPGYFLATDIVVALVIGIIFSTPYPGQWIDRITASIAIRSPRASNWSRTTGDLAMHTILFLLCAMAMSSRTYDPFIYFRF